MFPLACGSENPKPVSTQSTSAPASAATIHVVASFYPLQYVVQRVGGDRVSVENLTPIGAEPHELELTAKNTASLHDADLVVYLSGFSPAVDEAIDAVAAGHAFDVAPTAHVDLTYTPIDAGKANSAAAGVRDPHFWLDPTRLESVAMGVATELAKADPGDASLFRDNATKLIADLEALDGEYAAGLAHCSNTDIVTSHNAFGYLAQHYGLTQIGITGLTPEDEPSPADLAAVTDFVEQHHVATIYYETLVSPEIAETVASETGAATAVLDPIEGVSPESKGSDYFEVMRSNLSSLRIGQGCT